MNPTMKLRWVPRSESHKSPVIFDNRSVAYVLQQWWEDKRLIEIDGVNRYATTGEWRDIPIEEEK